MSDQGADLGRVAGEEGVIRSDLADVIDRASAMAAYAYEKVREARGPGGTGLSPDLAERLAKATYKDVMRYSLDECSCPCHQDHA